MVTVTLTVPATINSTTTSDTIAIRDWRLRPGGSGAIPDSPAPFTIAFEDDGFMSWRVGATIDVAAGQAPGDYANTFDFDIGYQ